MFLAGVSRSPFYFRGKGASAFNLKLTRLIDGQWLRAPLFISLRMAALHLRGEDYNVSRKLVRRLMPKTGLEPVYPRPKTSKPRPAHQACLYLLKSVTIDRSDHDWCAGIMFLPM